MKVPLPTPSQEASESADSDGLDSDMDVIAAWYEAKIEREIQLGRELMESVRQTQREADDRVQRWLNEAERWGEKLKHG